MKPPIPWLNRDLVVGPYLRLCLTQEQFDAVSDELRQPRAAYLNPGAHATTHHLGRGDDGTNICIVCVNGAEAATRDGIVVAGILIHEAVHAWQAYCEAVGEHSPSSEFEAYSIQILAQRLMWAYVEATKKE